MNLQDYPRPPADNGRGVHWSPSQYQWGRADWPRWRDRILEMGFKWIKIVIPPDQNATALVRRLVDIKVMPVCRYIRKNPTRIEGSIEHSIRELIDLGARYFETNNEPDADVEWTSGRRRPGWEEVVIENWVYDAERIIGMGGYPAFVAFNSGPNEPRDPIKILVDKGGGHLVGSGRIWISLHNYGKGRPINYPNDPVRMFGDSVTDEEWTNQGQPDFWTPEKLKSYVWHSMNRDEIDRRRAAQKNPNGTIQTDITGFRAYEYWDGLVTRQGFDSIPIMMTEGGWETGDRLDDFYPEPTAQRAGELNLAMFKFVQGDTELDIYQPDRTVKKVKVPDYLFAVMPWHMGEREFGLDTSGQWEQGAWFTHMYDREFGLNGELPIVQMLRDLPTRVRANGPVPPEWAKRDRRRIGQVDDGLTKTRWDYRLPYLGDGIAVERADAGQDHWRVVSGEWQDMNERLPHYPPPPGYILVKVLDADGQAISEAEVAVSRPGATDIIRTKGRLDQYWGNYFMSGLLGTYSLKVGHQADPTIFRFVFQLERGQAGAPERSEPPEVETEPEGETPVRETVPPLDREQPGAGTEAPAPEPEPGDEGATVEAPPGQPVEVDNDAGAFGVEVQPVPEAVYFKVVRVHHLTPQENHGMQNLFLDVLDEDGKRLNGATVNVRASSGQLLPVRIDKPAHEPGGNLPMFLGTIYAVEGVVIDGKPVLCQGVTGFHTNHPSDGSGNDTGRHSFLVVLRRSQRD
jgi:hypothetical protein